MRFTSSLPRLQGVSSFVCGPLLLRCRVGLEKILAGEVRALLASLRNTEKKNKSDLVVISNSGEVECRSPTLEAVNVLSQKCRVAHSITQRVTRGSTTDSPAYFPCTHLSDLIEHLGRPPLSEVANAFISQVVSVNSKLDGGPPIARKLNSALELSTEVSDGLPLVINITEDMCSVESVTRQHSTRRPWLQDEQRTGIVEDDGNRRQPSWSTIAPGKSPMPAPVVRPQPQQKITPPPTLAAAAILKTSVLSLLSRTSVNRANEGLIVWDPFCGHGTMMLELASVVLGIPLSGGAAATATPHSNAHKLQIIATDPVGENVSAALVNLRKFSTYCQPWFRYGSRSADGDSTAYPLGQKIKRDAIQHDEGIRAAQPAEAEEEFNLARPLGSDPKSFSTDEDATWNLPIRFSINQASFHSVLPHIQGPMIITHIHSQRFATHQGIRMFQSFGHLVGSRNDWTAVYVLTDSKAFQTYSRLVWETQLTIQTSSDSKMKLLRWTGLKRGEAAATAPARKAR